MEKIQFYKYHGTGNDFIMIDNRTKEVDFEDEAAVARLCDRRFGIGADGLILLETSSVYHFRMIYYNADGREGSMCGNGGRCIVAFARFLGITGDKTTFEAIDGIHQGDYINTRNGAPLIALKMNDVTQIARENENYVLDTGSPHYVTFCNDASTVDVVTEGKKIRYSNQYKAEGINVNFVSETGNHFSIRTYERGVEDETYSCGTGTVAAAIAISSEGKMKTDGPVRIDTKGGMLEVKFKRKGTMYTDIWLTGPAEQVYKGVIEI